MIFHASIPADQPQHVASVIAELWRGESFPFPPFPESFIAISNAGDGAEIEVTPRWMEAIPGKLEVEAQRNPQPSPYSASHLAIATQMNEAEVLALAAREGWTARLCNRGGAFDVIEFWVENRFMIEVLTPPMQKDYLAFMSPGGYRTFMERIAA